MRLVDTEDLRFREFVRAGDRVAWGQCAAEPLCLTSALMQQRHEIGGRFSVFIGTTWGDAVGPQHADVVDFQSWGGAGTNRKLAELGLLEVLCCHYSDLEYALSPAGPNKIDVLLLQIAPPGPDGHYSLSTGHEYLVPLLESARVVIAEVNERAPWTYGSRPVREDDIDVLVRTDHPLPAPPRQSATEGDLGVARGIEKLVEDGATLQLGVGSIPEAVLRELRDRRDLGIHSGAITDGIVDLVECGAVTNARKSIDRGLTVAGVLMGGPKLMAHSHLNPRLRMRGTAYTHGAGVLANQDLFMAVNGAVEVGVAGQVNAESAAGRYVGAVGGALDFLRGARNSRGGKAIIGLPSRAGSRGRIVAALSGPVSTPRSDVQYVVTEFGVADLRGATLAQRIRRMIDIAHPEDREALERESFAVLCAR